MFIHAKRIYSQNIISIKVIYDRILNRKCLQYSKINETLYFQHMCLIIVVCTIFELVKTY